MSLRRFTIIFALLFITAITSSCVGQVEASRPILEDITASEAFSLIEHNRDNPDFIILDIRTPEEFYEGHIENAVNIDFYADTFRDDLDALDKDKTYFIYCRSGNRSGRAMSLMKDLGFNEVYNLSVGIKEWVAEGFPVVK
ncbi:MAG TPA: rhodanese-like domain-containing protein [Dehalococcoidia bacterium]|nr:rhodanese-like domain-containing protein [Dehalococcoidia bacterium]